jgi:Flp pilus assembly protein TadB
MTFSMAVLIGVASFIAIGALVLWLKSNVAYLNRKAQLLVRDNEERTAIWWLDLFIAITGRLRTLPLKEDREITGENLRNYVKQRYFMAGSVLAAGVALLVFTPISISPLSVSLTIVVSLYFALSKGTIGKNAKDERLAFTAAVAYLLEIMSLNRKNSSTVYEAMRLALEADDNKYFQLIKRELRRAKVTAEPEAEALQRIAKRYKVEILDHIVTQYRLAQSEGLELGRSIDRLLRKTRLESLEAVKSSKTPLLQEIDTTTVSITTVMILAALYFMFQVL